MFWKTSSKILTTQTPPDQPYFRKAFDFMKAWSDGQEEFVIHTSGSTGAPKNITIFRSQLISSARMTGKALELGKGTHALVCLNIAYIAGMMMLVRGMELEWELTIVEPSSNPLAHVPENAVFDFISMVPSQLMACLDDLSTSDRINKVGKILLGGAPVSVFMKNRIKGLTVPVFQSYGMTETVSHVAIRRLNGLNRETAYQMLPDITIGVDERGCLHVAGAVTHGETIQTNDLVSVTSSSSFVWIGRGDNIINSGGVKIVLDSIDSVVEEVFLELNYSGSFYSWYQNDEKLGQRLILIIEGSRLNFDQSKLIEEIRKRVSAYETPKDVYFVPRFQKTQTDKIDKRLTAEMFFTQING